MCLKHVLLLVIATLLTCSNVSLVAADQTNPLEVQSPSLPQLNNAILNIADSRLLRVHDATADDEERAFNLKSIIDFIKKWFKNNDFTTESLNKMVNNPRFKTKKFKRWDKVTMENIRLKIGAENLNKDKIAEMLVDYVQNHRKYGKAKTSNY